MECIHYELKYCEGCGTLKLRPIKSAMGPCAICERLLARFRFPRKAWAREYAGLPVAAVPRQIAPAMGGTMPGGRRA